MKLQQMMTKNKTGSSLVSFITLPAQIVRAKQWNKGDNIIAEINKEGNIVLKRKE